jgi:hypothetical protein
MAKKMARIMLVLGLAGLLAANGAWAADTIKIGFHAPLTGFAASDGKSAATGSSS